MLARLFSIIGQSRLDLLENPADIDTVDLAIRRNNLLQRPHLAIHENDVGDTHIVAGPF